MRSVWLTLVSSLLLSGVAVFPMRGRSTPVRDRASAGSEVLAASMPRHRDSAPMPASMPASPQTAPAPRQPTHLPELPPPAADETRGVGWQPVQPAPVVHDSQSPADDHEEDGSEDDGEGGEGG